MSISITSPNINGVLQRMPKRHERVARLPAELPKKLFAGYLARLKEIAMAVMLAEFPEATAAEKAAINVLAGTIAGRAIKERMIFHMAGRSTTGMSNLSPEDLVDEMDRTDLMQGIRDWVDAGPGIGKDLSKDPQLPNESMDEYHYRIAGRVFYAAMADKDHWFRPDAEGEDGSTRLINFLGKGKLAQLMGVVNLSADRIDSILQQVLNAWTAWAQIEFKLDVQVAVAGAINIGVPRTT